MEAEQKSQLEERIALIEQRLSEVAKNVSDKADGHADVLVAKWAKQIIDSRFTWAFIAGAAVYAAMTFYICV